jgi:hypothetical protein
MESLIIDGVEEVKIVDNFKYVVDLRGQFTGDGSDKIQEGRTSRTRSFSNLRGKRVVIDWKTSGNALDQIWVQRYVGSHQWRLYLHKEKADIFIYRGIRRRNAINGDLETKEFMIHRSEDPCLDEAAARYIRLQKAQRDNLIKIGEFPWPMNRPEACNKYGYPCPYDSDCWSGNIPGGELSTDHPVSFSRMSDFLLCPERARRNQLASQSDEIGEAESESAAFGNAVHRGLAELYRQAFGLKEN